MAKSKSDLIDTRLTEVRDLLLTSPTNDPTGVGLDALLDAFLVLYDECSNATLKREKTVAEFLQYGKRDILFHS